jgi:hypothetical protein
VQRLEDRIVCPKGFGRNYRCVTKYINSYTLEELANLVWIGCLINAVAPKGFQQLWKKLQPALKHYLFGFEARETDMRSAAKSMLDFARMLEEMVIKQWVRFPPSYL